MSRVFDLRVRQYTVGGDAGPVVPTLDIGATVPNDTLGVLRCSVSQRVFGTLPTIMEAALEYWDPDEGDGGEWIEPSNARFLIRDSGVDERERSNTISLAGVTLWDYLMRKAIVETGDSELVDGHRPFNSATGGAIVKTLVDEAQGRGWGPMLDYSFTATHDSAGDPWESIISIAYQPGRTTLLMVLENLVEQGLVERETEGRTLHLYNPGHGVDRGPATEHPVRVGASAQQMPTRRNIDDLLTDLAFFGESGFRLDVPNDGAYAGLGRLEGAILQGGVNDEGTATLLGQPTLLAGRAAREQIAATEYVDRADALPWKHYQPGDWVAGRRGTGAWEKLRVRAVVVAKDVSNRITSSPTLNDRFEDVLARLAKRTNGILGGAVAGGTGAVPNPGNDTRKPKAPTDVIVTSSGYWTADGVSQAQIAADWADVTEAENDVAIEVVGYQMWGRPDDGETPPRILAEVTSSHGTASPFPPQETWLVTVRAESHNGVWSDFSDEVEVVTDDAPENLEKPQPPILASRNGVVFVATSGLFDTDPPTMPPASFRELRIERAADSAGPYVTVGVLTRSQDSRTFGDMAIGDTWHFRFVPVDRLGRDGEYPSDPAAIEVVGIDGADLIVDTLEGNRIKAGTLTVDAVEPGFGNALQIDGNVTITATQAAVAAVGADVAEVSGAVEAVAADVEVIGTYFDFAPDGLTISAPGSDFSQRIASDRTEFRQGAQVISYLEAGQFVAPRMVTETAAIADHIWSKAPADAGTVVRATR